MKLILIVVNCFQKLLSSWWRTTKEYKSQRTIWLWIAFKNYYLRDEGQPSFFLLAPKTSCELLSKIIIFVMKDNLGGSMMYNGLVVNCFQKLLSSWWRTTNQIIINNLGMLWIAFKNYYLRDEGQLRMLPTSRLSRLWIAFKNYYLRDEGQPADFNPSCLACCELLSKIIIFVMKDNSISNLSPIFIVVNCFQKLLSSWWRTTC